MENKEKVFAALIKFQGECPPVPKTGKHATFGAYTTLDDMVNTTKPSLIANDLSISQLVSSQGVNTVLIHKSGQYLETGFFGVSDSVVLASGNKGNTAIQKEGICISYIKRYQYAGILDIVDFNDNEGETGENKNLIQFTKTNFESLKKRLDEGTKESPIDLNKVNEWLRGYSFTVKMYNQITELNNQLLK